MPILLVNANALTYKETQFPNVWHKIKYAFSLANHTHIFQTRMQKTRKTQDEDTLSETILQDDEPITTGDFTSVGDRVYPNPNVDQPQSQLVEEDYGSSASSDYMSQHEEEVQPEEDSYGNEGTQQDFTESDSDSTRSYNVENI